MSGPREALHPEGIMNIRKLAAPVAVLVTALAIIGATSGEAQATSVPQVNPRDRLAH